jgi:hypothetical protein
MMGHVRRPSEVVAHFLRDADIAAPPGEVSFESTEPRRMWEVVVSASDDIRKLVAAQPHHVPAADPLTRDDTVMLDVVAFYPIPDPICQGAIRNALASYRDTWRRELQRVRDELRTAMMYALPCGQLLVGGPERWVTEGRVDHVSIGDYVQDWEGEGAGYITYIRRPYVAWPRSGADGRHVMMVAFPDGNREVSLTPAPLESPRFTP